MGTKNATFAVSTVITTARTHRRVQKCQQKHRDSTYAGVIRKFQPGARINSYIDEYSLLSTTQWSCAISNQKFSIKFTHPWAVSRDHLLPDFGFWFPRPFKVSNLHQSCLKKDRTSRRTMIDFISSGITSVPPVHTVGTVSVVGVRIVVRQFSRFSFLSRHSVLCIAPFPFTRCLAADSRK